MSSEPAVRRYHFLGLHLAVSGSSAALDALQSRLGYFPSAETQNADLHFEFITLDRGAPHPLTRPVGDARPIGPVRIDGFQAEYFRADDCLYIDYRNEVRALCDARRSRVRISVAAPEARNLWTATRPVFVLSLFELLKRHGYFNVHAAGLSLGNRVLLLAGHSGAGKSTLAAALCRAGFAFMADDYVFLTRQPDRLRVMAFPEELEMREEAGVLIPELKPLLDRTNPSGWWKHQVRAEDYWQTSLAWEGTPAAVVFPAVANTATSQIAPMSAPEAMSRLVANIQYTQPELAQEHVDVFGALVRSCSCYRLDTGRDLESVAAMLRGRLESSACLMDLS